MYNEYQRASLQDLEKPAAEFPYKEGLTDLVLRVEDEDLHVNKGILMTVSPVFEKMLLSDCREKHTKTVELKEKSLSSVKLFLKCIYPNYKVEFDDKIVDEVLPIAHEYQSDLLVRQCQEFLLQKYFTNNYPYSKTPDIKTLVKCMCYSHTYNLHLLREASMKLLARCKLSTFYDIKEFQDLPMDVKHLIFVRRIIDLESICSSGFGGSISNETVVKFNVDLTVKDRSRFTGFNLTNVSVSDLFRPERHCLIPENIGNLR